MAVTRVSQSTLKEGLEKFTSALGGFVPFPVVYDSLQTTTVGAGGTATITFSSIPQTYQHLQIRYLLPSSVSDNNIILRFNGDSGANYTLHELNGNGASAAAVGLTSLNFARIGYWFNGGPTLSRPTVGIVDLLDYSSSTKNTVVRTFSGQDDNGGGSIRVISAAWLNTSAVTSITLAHTQGAQSWPQHSTAALYGLRAP